MSCPASPSLQHFPPERGRVGPQEGPGLWRGLIPPQSRGGERGHRSGPGPVAGGRAWCCHSDFPPRPSLRSGPPVLPGSRRLLSMWGSLGGAALALPQGCLGMPWDLDPASPRLGREVRPKLSCCVINLGGIGFAKWSRAGSTGLLALEGLAGR